MTIDTKLIEGWFAPAAGWLHRNLGIDQWRAAMECVNGATAFYLAGVAFTIARKGPEDAIFLDLLTAMLWLGVMEIARRTARRQAGSSLGTQSARLSEWIFRTVLVALIPLSLVSIEGLDDFCHFVALQCLVAHLYFKACDIPPPEPRRRLARQPG